MPRVDSASVEQAFFNDLVTTDGDFNPFSPLGWQRIRDVFTRMIRRRGPFTMLDVGAGTGRSRQIYRDDASRYVGLDISDAAVEHARRHQPDAEWVVGDACQLCFADDTFDLVAFSSVLHHIPRFQVALREARRVLKPGGIVFAFDPNILHPAMALFRWPRSPFYSPVGVSPNESPMLPSVLRHGFHDAGFVSVRQECRSGIAYRDVSPRFASNGLAAFNVLDGIWEACGVGRWFGTFVFTCAEKPKAG